jgi:hypothetical protein
MCNGMLLLLLLHHNLRTWSSMVLLGLRSRVLLRLRSTILHGLNTMVLQGLSTRVKLGLRGSRALTCAADMQQQKIISECACRIV